ncbi:MAG: hypothetical protein ABIS50_19970 [Luteolibacter sp.]|uniref:hypothetical protein n=1 Tax=Luteolibacter sp. TaxID=1962973 RepID=UPI003267C16A
MNLSKVNPSELLKLYQAFHPGKPFTPEDVRAWGLSHGYDVTPVVDLEAAALRKIKQAIKKSSFTDPQGRKVPMYISVGNEEESLPLWSELAITPHNIVQKSVNMSRTKAVQTLAQAQTVTDSYNDNFNLSGEDVRLNLIVEEDVAEEIIMRRNRGKNKDSFDDEDGED